MLLVADIGPAEGVTVDLLYEVLKQASRAGADVAKFRLYGPDQTGGVDRLDPEVAQRLQKWCRWWDIRSLVSVDSERALEVATKLDPDGYTFEPQTVFDQPHIVEWALEETKPSFIPLGWWDQQKFPFGSPDRQRRYIYCRPDGPTYPHQLQNMPSGFGAEGYFGYRDRMHGIEGCLLAISRGARYIEKPFTLDRLLQSGQSQQVCEAIPTQLRQLHELGRPLGRLADTIGSRRRACETVP